VGRGGNCEHGDKYMRFRPEKEDWKLLCLEKKANAVLEG
jgi:hypothetical protein